MTHLPQHLGGHENETHIDDGALSYFIENFDVKSMVDIGCGPGGMVDLAKRKGLDVIDDRGLAPQSAMDRERWLSPRHAPLSFY